MDKNKQRNKTVRNANLKIKKECIEKGIQPTHMWCSVCNTLKSVDEMVSTSKPTSFFKKLSCCHKCNAEKMRVYKEKNRDNINRKNRESYPSRKDEFLKKQKIYTNSEEYKKKRRAHLKKKYKENAQYRIKLSLRGRLLKAVKANGGIKKKTDVYGIDWNLSVTHLGPVPDTINRWSIDHIIPCDAFDMNNDRHVYLCFHHTNLRWLEYDRNAAKNNKIIPKLINHFNLSWICDDINLDLTKHVEMDVYFEEFK